MNGPDPLPTTAPENQLAWLALTLTPGLGPKRILKTAQTLQDVSRLFQLSLTELESLNFPAPSAQFLFSGKARVEAEQEWKRCANSVATILTLRG